MGTEMPGWAVASAGPLCLWTGCRGLCWGGQHWGRGRCASKHSEQGQHEGAICPPSLPYLFLRLRDTATPNLPRWKLFSGTGLEHQSPGSRPGPRILLQGLPKSHPAHRHAPSLLQDWALSLILLISLPVSHLAPFYNQGEAQMQVRICNYKGKIDTTFPKRAQRMKFNLLKTDQHHLAVPRGPTSLSFSLLPILCSLVLTLYEVY